MSLEVEITNILFDKGTLMDLYIGRWAAIKKLQPDDVLLENVDTDALYLGHKKLLPKKAMEKLVTLEGKARVALSKRSIEFPIGGGRFVYYKALPEVLKLLGDLQKQWAEEVATLIQDYPNLRELQLQALDEQAKKLATEALKKTNSQAEHEAEYARLETWREQQRTENKELYPTADELKAKFPFDWRMFKVSPLQGLEQMSTLDAGELLAAQSKLKADLEKWVKEAATVMHKALGEAAAQANKLLEKNGKLNPKNLKPLFEAFETFKAIDFTGSSSFQKTIEEVKQKFGIEKDGQIDYELTAGALNVDDYQKAGLTTLLGTMAKLAVEETAQAAGQEAISKVGEFSRFVALD